MTFYSCLPAEIKDDIFEAKIRGKKILNSWSLMLSKGGGGGVCWRCLSKGMRFCPAIVNRPEEVQVKERRAQSICSMQKKKKIIFQQACQAAC